LTDEEVLERSTRICQWLYEKGATQIIIACNTATSIAIDRLREILPIPIIGIEPAIKPASIQSISKKIAVLATPATLRTERFKRLMTRYGDELTIYAQTPDHWVEAVEDNYISHADVTHLVKKTLMPLIEAGVDQIVLGCTHYPFLLSIIEEVTKGTIHVIDPAAAVVKQACSFMETQDTQTPFYAFYTTSQAIEMEVALKRLLNTAFPVKKITI
jgi:glutamate racemase